MDITFTNGTPEQHQAVKDALGDLLHLNTDTAYPFPWDISFVPNPVADPTVHHPFAVTTLTTGHPLTKIRDDFPRFAPIDSWGSAAFARETVIHELGHAAEANLGTDIQNQVAALFGSTQAGLYPTDRSWQDRPGEGMAETFKDAFLPQRDRQYSNRTNVSIPISKYPSLRKLFRSGSVGTGGTGTTIDHFDTDTLPNYEWHADALAEASILTWDSGHIDVVADSAVGAPTAHWMLTHPNAYGDGLRGVHWNSGTAAAYPILILKWLSGDSGFDAGGVNAFSALIIREGTLGQMARVFNYDLSAFVPGLTSYTGPVPTIDIAGGGAGNNLPAFISANTEYWLLADVQGNVITLNLYGADPFQGASPIWPTITLTLSGVLGQISGLAQQFFGAGIAGRPGVGWADRAVFGGAHGMWFDDLVIGAGGGPGGTPTLVPEGNVSGHGAVNGARRHHRRPTG